MSERTYVLTGDDIEAVFAEWWRRWSEAPEDYIDLEDAGTPAEYGIGAGSDFVQITSDLMTVGTIPTRTVYRDTCPPTVDPGTPIGTGMTRTTDAEPGVDMSRPDDHGMLGVRR